MKRGTLFLKILIYDFPSLAAVHEVAESDMTEQLNNNKTRKKRVRKVYLEEALIFRQEAMRYYSRQTTEMAPRLLPKSTRETPFP